MSKLTVNVGGVRIGGGAPISIQSMTNTDTRDVKTTVAQILELEREGCEIVRSSVYDERCVEAIKSIIPCIHIPLVADIHFDHRLAIGSIKAGVSKVRINPGNIGSEAKVRELAACASAHGVPIRIGVNGGSLEKDLLQKYGVCAEAMVESAMRHADMLENVGFHDIVISLKASDVATTIRAYRLAAERMPYPLHVGVTEAGMGEGALLKSAIGIGSLLVDGIGDTVRVSMTGNVTQEVRAAKKILAAVGIRKYGAEVISCPTCGRTRVNLPEIVERVNAELPKDGRPIRIAVMGCAVNGPGESAEADIGIAFGSVNAAVFEHGEIRYTDALPGVIDRFIADAAALMKSESIKND
ncbi:MAG: flavodoxin-dependent (E)-4-hydroxy-3-methylbut-2-enyl-diphosphate synthase [Christensenellaceae bacterium]|nr:flavodoxin-dependent (E)-4-hydroxy-3-methylbut-2-enyl-diphosphate synthase [Christensenellaceae bacterium]